MSLSRINAEKAIEFRQVTAVMPVPKFETQEQEPTTGSDPFYDCRYCFRRYFGPPWIADNKTR